LFDESASGFRVSAKMRVVFISANQCGPKLC
jgi:hypothetical protein